MTAFLVGFMVGVLVGRAFELWVDCRLAYKLEEEKNNEAQ